MDEGVLWTHKDRVFWMFHESHHKYEHLGGQRRVDVEKMPEELETIMFMAPALMLMMFLWV